jgi:hypothetical protein
MDKPKNRRWTGELANPIYMGAIPGIEATKGWVKTWPDGKRLRADRYSQAVIWSERIRKLDLLRKHYRIKNSQDFFSLALRLAMDCVPGFRVVDDKRLTFRRGKNYGGVILADKGRPLEWSPEKISELRRAVKKAKGKYQLQTDREALERVIQTCAEWSRPLDRSFEGWRKTLQNRLAANPEK